MYKKNGSRLLKHLDFLILDLFALEIAYALGYYLRFHNQTVYPTSKSLYVLMAVLLGSLLVVVDLASNAYEGILHRGYGKEFARVLFETVAVFALVSAYLFLSKDAISLSRLTLLYAMCLFLILDYAGRCLLKRLVRRRLVQNPERSMLIYTTEAQAETAVRRILANEVRDFLLAGIVLHDGECLTTRDGQERKICGVPVVASRETAVSYICTGWVDEVLIDLPVNTTAPGDLVNQLILMGVAVHQTLPGRDDMNERNQFVERICGRTVVTTTINSMTAGQALCKRLMDIVGGLVGSLLTLILTLFVGPAILVKSPGPIFFKQKRVGKNGKVFTIYKFRSMYLDAEERKKELEKKNKMEGLLFKVDDDPRIIKGVGTFIRKHSIDEFPQFFNVLKGDMSLVGTRPPTLDEWKRYEPHHRLRMAAKPGLTGMWQVSGRSDIVDFEEVVRLDEKYIRNWDIAMDLRILLKTVEVVFTGKGAE